ncbi:MAG: exodeoxyribonuclease VII small subunit [Candidatus Eremiobacteraeota bacterium]|nr:exodeoxyribonuclease VII small subunit [Candidatus Eremiobacteraeota bacterium]
MRELESGNVDLDNAVRLFNEGKKLARDCELLLKSAQEQIDRAMQAPPDADDEIPF